MGVAPYETPSKTSSSTSIGSKSERILSSITFTSTIILSIVLITYDAHSRQGHALDMVGTWIIYLFIYLFLQQAGT